MNRAGGPYRTIKELVFEHIHQRNGSVSYDDLTREVLSHFPNSAWKRSHWAFYCYQIRSGRYRNEFTEQERANLAPIRRPINQLGDEILREARQAIAKAAGGDSVLRFRLNRWVFSRLQLHERRLKQPVKQALWDAGARSCPECKKAFVSLKALHIHRKDPKLDYTASNCVLLCARCHLTHT
jgi:hypothetical protein